ncbi:MAG: polysaccharide deacetylase family protein, partial [Gluconacetobacter diazotrophicus]|nr:polysaccharide deacetylase family protein [Gluconacetobacter diazotrophicus]
LDRLLTYLASTGWSVVTVSDAQARAADPRARGRTVNFSIDDCYRDTFEHVVPLFRRHNVPVTLFVTTGIPDGTLPMWAAGLEDVLASRDTVRLDGGTITAGTAVDKRAAFAQIAAAWDGPDAGRHYAAFCGDNGVDAAAMHVRHAISWNMLAELSRDPLVEIGAHTVNHIRLSTATPDAAFFELQGSRRRLEEKLGIPVRHFAFPYGQSGDCGPREFDLARKAGFGSVTTTGRGLLRPGPAPFVLPRNTLNGKHKSLLMAEAHLTGLVGLAARVLGRV